MPLAVFGVMAGASLIKGAMDAHAAKKAAKTQVAAGDKAQAVNQQVYQQQLQQMQPWAQGGQSVFGDLTQAWQAKQRGQMPQYAPQGFGGSQGLPSGAPVNQFGGGQPQSPFAQALSQRPQSPQGAPMGGPGMGQGQMVLMRAPTGEQRPIPADQVGRALQAGATRIG